MCQLVCMDKSADLCSHLSASFVLFPLRLVSHVIFRENMLVQRLSLSHMFLISKLFSCWMLCPRDLTCDKQNKEQLLCFFLNILFSSLDYHSKHFTVEFAFNPFRVNGKCSLSLSRRVSVLCGLKQMVSPNMWRTRWADGWWWVSHLKDCLFTEYWKYILINRWLATFSLAFKSIAYCYLRYRIW